MKKRWKFHEVFRETINGSLTPERLIRIGGATFGPGVTFSRGVSFGGVDIFQFYGHDIEAEEHGDVLVITGFYR